MILASRGKKKWHKVCDNCGAKTRKIKVNNQVVKDGLKFLVTMNVFKCKKCNATHYIKKERHKVLKEIDKLYPTALEHKLKEEEEAKLLENEVIESGEEEQ